MNLSKLQCKIVRDCPWDVRRRNNLARSRLPRLRHLSLWQHKRKVETTPQSSEGSAARREYSLPTACPHRSATGFLGMAINEVLWGKWKPQRERACDVSCGINRIRLALYIINHLLITDALWILHSNVFGLGFSEFSQLTCVWKRTFVYCGADRVLRLRLQSGLLQEQDLTDKAETEAEPKQYKTKKQFQWWYQTMTSMDSTTFGSMQNVSLTSDPSRLQKSEENRFAAIRANLKSTLDQKQAPLPHEENDPIYEMNNDFR